MCVDRILVLQDYNVNRLNTSDGTLKNGYDGNYLFWKVFRAVYRNI